MSRLAEFAVWWVVVTVIWLMTLTTASVAELVLAVVASIPAAVAATAGRRVLVVSGRPSRNWLRWLAQLPPTILAETARLPLTVRSPQHTRKVVLPRGASRLDRAVAAWTMSATPGSVVLDDRHGELVVHAANARTSRLERSVRS
ncbi:Na+/H+ antiporter subunit E [Fodinicola acaciae]|uniref:Na+/H+ antiporter subunit E n=1 Tax=Fodinicola acaciae TaxID=2681555 RepID=UPI0013CF90A5|nr:Na+/H+ antiporter subunit E [Fodinicola acaciae]